VRPEVRLAEAIALIASVPGYEPIAQNLTRRTVRYEPTLEDRGQATLTGAVLIGPEALLGGVVGLAETLVHEEYHTRQNHLLKTHSFWSGVFTKTPVMARYERPAYQAAADFLEALARAQPAHADEARAEAELVRASYRALYRLAP
jgi:hypothetical protein